MAEEKIEKSEETQEKKGPMKFGPDDQLIVTREILNEVRQNIGPEWGRTDEQLLESIRRMSGRKVVLVDKVPEDDDIVVICAPEAVVPGSLKATCAECGTTVYHSRHAPAHARKICTRCGPRLGH
jgi:hypothetical protein